MENGTHNDLIVAAVRKSIALEVLAGYLFLSAITIAFALASGPAQLLLGLLWAIIFVVFANSESHRNERLHYGLYVINDSKSTDGESNSGKS
jgi:hypothetical protein